MRIISQVDSKALCYYRFFLQARNNSGHPSYRWRELPSLHKFFVSELSTTLPSSLSWTETNSGEN